MKKILLLLLSIITINTFACFFDNPITTLTNEEHILTNENINMQLSLLYPKIKNPIESFKWNGFDYTSSDIIIQSYFPMTLNISLQLDNARVKNLYLLYLNKNGKFVILKRFLNVQFTVVNENHRAIFGINTITNSCGYNKGQVLFIFIYFEAIDSNNQQISNYEGGLSSLLNVTVTDPTEFDNLIPIGVLKR